MNSANERLRLTCWVAFLYCVAPALAGTSRTITFSERSSRTFETTTATVTGDEIYLPMTVLVDRLGLERKALPGRRVGICRQDLCVPFSIGEGPADIRLVGNLEHVPVRHLAKTLRGTSLWKADENDLMLDFMSRPAATLASHPDSLDLTLPDLTGKPVPFSAFRGKKVLVFAWASW